MTECIECGEWDVGDMVQCQDCYLACPWIKIDSADDLPPLDGEYLVWFEGRKAILPFSKGAWRWGDGSFMEHKYASDVKAWHVISDYEGGGQ